MKRLVAVAVVAAAVVVAFPPHAGAHVQSSAQSPYIGGANVRTPHAGAQYNPSAGSLVFGGPKYNPTCETGPEVSDEFVPCASGSGYITRSLVAGPVRGTWEVTSSTVWVWGPPPELTICLGNTFVAGRESRWTEAWLAACPYSELVTGRSAWAVWWQAWTDWKATQ